jgi:hypothetical protein
VDPAHFCGRYALKYVHLVICFLFRLTKPSNMLTVSFATRTDSTNDPLVECALALAVEFMALTGQ